MFNALCLINNSLVMNEVCLIMHEYGMRLKYIIVYEFVALFELLLTSTAIALYFCECYSLAQNHLSDSSLEFTQLTDRKLASFELHY